METIDWLVAAALAKSVLALGSRIGLIQFKHRLRHLYGYVSQLQTAVIFGLRRATNPHKLHIDGDASVPYGAFRREIANRKRLGLISSRNTRGGR